MEYKGLVATTCFAIAGALIIFFGSVGQAIAGVFVMGGAFSLTKKTYDKMAKKEEDKGKTYMSYDAHLGIIGSILAVIIFFAFPDLKSTETVEQTPAPVAAPVVAPVVAEPKEIQQTFFSETNGKAEFIELYYELQSFKGNRRFHEVGFAECCEYAGWLTKAKELNDFYGTDFFRENQVAVGELIGLGLEYMKNKGAPTKYSRDLEGYIAPVLK